MSFEAYGIWRVVASWPFTSNFTRENITLTDVSTIFCGSTNVTKKVDRLCCRALPVHDFCPRKNQLNLITEWNEIQAKHFAVLSKNILRGCKGSFVQVNLGDRNSSRPVGDDREEAVQLEGRSGRGERCRVAPRPCTVFRNTEGFTSNVGRDSAGVPKMWIVCRIFRTEASKPSLVLKYFTWECVTRLQSSSVVHVTERREKQSYYCDGGSGCISNPCLGAEISSVTLSPTPFLILRRVPCKKKWLFFEIVILVFGHSKWCLENEAYRSNCQIKQLWNYDRWCRRW